MSNDGVNEGRRRFLTGATTVVGAVGVVGAAVPFVGSWNPSAKARAAGAPVRVNISNLDPGARMTVEWRGRPVFVVRRTQDVVDSLSTDLLTRQLRDPESQASVQPDYVDPVTRSIRPEFLVLVGLCTHLGCAPLYRPEVGAQDLGGEDWLGGFFCPCHGSKFDMAGRVFRGVPAPTNLDVPPHAFETDSVLIVGIDQEAS